MRQLFVVVCLTICCLGLPNLAADLAGTTSINPTDGAEMVWVPGGTFIMGAPKGKGVSNNFPLHVVMLTGFWLYKYEVTVAQYCAFCTAVGRTLPTFPADEYSWKGKDGWNDPALQQHPIVNVNWHDAQAYAVWAKAALPTEAQWEYAARGPKGYNYPWGGIATVDNENAGEDYTKFANCLNSVVYGISTWPVGSFPAGASWCGAQELSGNVSEWCADWYSRYSAKWKINPTGPAMGMCRVIRGGTWLQGGGDGSAYRGAGRGSGDPDDMDDIWANGQGFRCVTFAPAPQRKSEEKKY